VAEKEVVATTAEGIEFTFKAQSKEIARAQASAVPNPGKQRGGGGMAYLNPNSPDNQVIMKIPLEAHAKGLLKEFNITKKMQKHVFSPNHADTGIRMLGNSEEQVLELIADIIKKRDYEGLLKSNDRFKAMINNCPVEIRVRVEEGSVLMMNAFRV
jgi:hypothetical protein